MIRRPTAAILEAHAGSDQVLACQRLEVGLQSSTYVPATLVDAPQPKSTISLFPRLDEIGPLGLTKCRVPLLERALIASPMTEQFMFHVEHAPVHQPTTTGRSLLDESMHARINDLDRQDLGDV